MPIGLICVVPQELTYLRASLTHSYSQQVAHTVFDVGTIDWHDVVLTGSGIGKVNAALVTTLAADRFSCRTVGFSGVVGALEPATGDRRHRHRRSRYPTRRRRTGGRARTDLPA